MTMLNFVQFQLVSLSCGKGLSICGRLKAAMR